MHVPFGRILFGAVMAVHGLVLLGQVYLFPDAGAALRLHRDLAPDADFQFVALKVLFWGLAGLAFLVAGIGISTGKRDWLPAAFVGYSEEVAFARKLCARNSWPVIDVTRRSIEETAAAVLNLYNERQKLV